MADHMLALFSLPSWSWNQLYLAVPHLVAYGKSIGLPVVQHDLAIEFIDFLFNSKTLDEYKPRSRDSLNYNLLWNFAKSNIGQAVKKMRRQDCSHDVGANNAFQATTTLYEMRYPTSTFGLNGIQFWGYSIGSTSSIQRKVLELSRQNKHPLTLFLREWIRLNDTSIPPIVGISIAGVPQVVPSLLFSYLLKRNNPSTVLIVGGSWISLIAKWYLNKLSSLASWIDAFAVYDGEPVLSGLREGFEKSRRFSLSNVPNLITHHEGIPKIKKTAFVDLHGMPSPDFTGIPIEKYGFPQTFPVEVSRGCYWGKCAFCNIKSGVNERFRCKSAKAVADEVARLKKRYNAKRFVFSSASIRPRFLSEISAQLIRRKENVRWSSFVRLEDGLDEKAIRQIKKSGCHHLGVAPESFCSETLKRMHKGFMLKNVMSVVRRIKHIYGKVNVNIIACFPGENIDDFIRTMEACRREGACGTVFKYDLKIGSPIWHSSIDYGIKQLEPPSPNDDIATSFQCITKKGIAQYTWKHCTELLALLYPQNINVFEDKIEFRFDGDHDEWGVQGHMMMDERDYGAGLETG